MDGRTDVWTDGWTDVEGYNIIRLFFKRGYKNIVNGEEPDAHTKGIYMTGYVVRPISGEETLSF